MIYFVAVGFVLSTAFNFDFTTYLASAAVYNKSACVPNSVTITYRAQFSPGQPAATADGTRVKAAVEVAKRYKEPA